MRGLHRNTYGVNVTDLSDYHDGEVIKYAFAELRVVGPIFVQSFHGRSHF